MQFHSFCKLSLIFFEFESLLFSCFEPPDHLAQCLIYQIFAVPTHILRHKIICKSLLQISPKFWSINTSIYFHLQQCNNTWIYCLPVVLSGCLPCSESGTQTTTNSQLFHSLGSSSPLLDYHNSTDRYFIESA